MGPAACGIGPLECQTEVEDRDRESTCDCVTPRTRNTAFSGWELQPVILVVSVGNEVVRPNLDRKFAKMLLSCGNISSPPFVLLQQFLCKVDFGVCVELRLLRSKS